MLRFLKYFVISLNMALILYRKLLYINIMKLKNIYQPFKTKQFFDECVNSSMK